VTHTYTVQLGGDAMVPRWRLDRDMSFCYSTNRMWCNPTPGGLAWLPYLVGIRIPSVVILVCSSAHSLHPRARRSLSTFPTRKRDVGRASAVRRYEGGVEVIQGSR
jgi:hypothetical protein